MPVARRLQTIAPRRARDGRPWAARVALVATAALLTSFVAAPPAFANEESGTDAFVGAPTMTMPTGTGDFSQSEFADVADSTLETGETTPTCVTGMAASLWWTFTPTQSQTLVFDDDTSAGDVGLQVVTGTTVGSNDEVACNDDAVPGTDTHSHLVLHATASTTYHLRMALKTAGPVYAGFTVKATAGDDFALSQPLTTYGSQDLTDATTEVGEPTPSLNGCSGALTNTVWYTYTPAARTSATITPYMYGNTSEVAVYTGDSLGALSTVTCVRNSPGVQNPLSFSATAGVHYRILVGVQGTVSSPYIDLYVNESTPPANDDFAAASTLLSGSASGEFGGASTEPGEPLSPAGGCSGTLSQTLWYAYTPSSKKSATLSGYVYGADSEVVVYTGSAVDGLTAVACGKTLSGAAEATPVSFAAASGTTYHIQVGLLAASSSASLYLNLSETTFPTNDDISAATAATTTPYDGFYANQNNTAATLESGESALCSGTVTKSLWYKVTATTATGWSVRADDYSSTPAVAVYRGTSATIAGLTQVACGAASTSGSAKTSSATWLSPAAATTYYIQVGTQAGTTPAGGDLSVTIEQHEVAANDNRASAKALPTSGSFNESVDLTVATFETGEPAPSCATTAKNTIWYKVTASAAGLGEVVTRYSSADTVVAVYSGAAAPTTTSTKVICSDNISVSNTTSKVTFNTVAGTTYWVQVATKGATGDVYFEYSLHSKPTNDTAATAVVMHELVDGSYGNADSTLADKAGDPAKPASCGTAVTAIGHTVWWKMKAPTSGTLRVDTRYSYGVDTVLVLWSGTTTPTTAVACNDNISSTDLTSLINANVTSGGTYWVEVGSKNSTVGGELELDWRLRVAPVNDSFLDAPLWEHTYEGDYIDLYKATTQTGEVTSPTGGDCSGTISRTAWYRVELPMKAVVTVGTSGTANTKIVVYKRSSTGTPTSPSTTCSDKGTAPAAAVWTASAGVSYLVGVGMAGTAVPAGDVGVNLNAIPVPTNNAFATAKVVSSMPWSDRVWNSTATTETSEQLSPSTCGATAKTVWYRYVAPAAGTVTVKAVGSSNLRIAAFRGTTLSGLVFRGCNNDVAADDKSSSLSFAVTSGTTYAIQVGSDATPSDYGTYVSMTGPAKAPVNDSKTAPTVIGSLPYAAEASNAAATTQTGESLTCGGTTGKTLWYRYTPAATGAVRISLANSDPSMTVAVFQGSATGTRVACNNRFNYRDARAILPVTGGQAYYIQVGSTGGVGGHVYLDVTSTTLRTLTASKNGTGLVYAGSGSTGAISCGTVCTNRFAQSEQEFLYTTPALGYVLSTWTNSCPGDGFDCGVVLSANRTATANFTSVGTRTIGVTVVTSGGPSGTSGGKVITSGAGGGSVTCTTGTCAAKAITYGGEANSFASPNKGYVFSGFTGACTSTYNYCGITMSANKTVTAKFTYVGTVTLTAAVSPSGGGRVTSYPSGISCPTTCSATFTKGDFVQLVATPGPAWKMGSWSNSCGTDIRCYADTQVSGTYTVSLVERMVNLAVELHGAGTVTAKNGTTTLFSCTTTCLTHSVRGGTTVTLTGVHGTGTVLSGWGGSAAGSASTATVKLDVDGRIATANFPAP